MNLTGETPASSTNLTMFILYIHIYKIYSYIHLYTAHGTENTGNISLNFASDTGSPHVNSIKIHFDRNYRYAIEV